MSRALFYGAAKIYCGPAGHADVFCWLEEALLRGIIRPPRARFVFIRRDQPGHGQSGLVPEEWH